MLDVSGRAIALANPDSVRRANYLLYGELLAEAAATALSAAMPTDRIRHAYDRQAADERRHAGMFRKYLRDIGAEPVSLRDVPMFDAYRRCVLGAAEKGHLVTAVMGVNVMLEGLASIGLELSARWVDAAGDDPAWVEMLRAIERDERRHVQLAWPALRSLGGGELPRESAEAFGEVRAAAIATMSAASDELSSLGIDGPMLFDAALRASHPELLAALDGGGAAA